MQATIVLVLLLIASASPLAAADRHAQSITGTLIAPYGGDWATIPQAVNNRGEIAGFAVSANDEWVVFLRSSGGRYQRIADNGFVNDMNDKGDVVGVLFPVDSGFLEGFVWNRRGGLQSLGSFIPLAINSRQDMAGVCEPPGGARTACVLRDGVVSVIPDAAEARGINRDGTVVGIYGDNRAFRLTDDWRFRDIGRGVAEDINDRGVIAGHRFLEVPDRGERAVVTAWKGRTVRSPGDVGLGVGINKDGWVISVGFRLNDEGIDVPFGFAWSSETGARVLLQGKGGAFVLPEAINDDGLIVGTADGNPIVWRLRKHGRR